MDAGGHPLILDGPLEGPDDPPDTAVDLRPGQSRVDHRLPDRRQRQRAELAGDRMTVEFPENPEAQPE
jgi:hypothetical protein